MNIRFKTWALALALALGPAAAVQAQVNVAVQIALPGVQIGIDMPSYPQLVRVPGQPVYYSPQADNNYFYYGSQFWVYAENDWYASRWYNGPWQQVSREAVPVYVLRVPVRYYSRPPGHFRGWKAGAAPRWNEHWGADWAQRRPGWDRSNGRVPAAAALPSYQRDYRGEHYPRELEQQRVIGSQRWKPVPPPKAIAVREPLAQAAKGKPDKHGCRPGQPGCGTDQPKGRSDGKGQGHGQGHGNKGEHGPSR